MKTMNRILSEKEMELIVQIPPMLVGGYLFRN